MRKEKKNKQNYPRKSCKGLMKTLFWAGFFGVLVMGALGVVRTVNLDARTQTMQAELRKQGATLAEIAEVENEEEGDLEVNEEGARLYATGFAKEFYTWGFGEEKVEDRNGRLQAYLADGLDASGGYDISGIETASSVDSCDVWEIKTDGNKIDVTVKVAYTLSSQEEKKKKAVETVEVQDVRYLLVPLVTDGEIFRVRALPYFVQAPGTLAYDYQPDQPEASLLVTDEGVCSEVGSFLDTFFKVATTGTAEELAYYASDGTELESLNGIYLYNSIQQAVVYQDGEGYQVSVEAVMQDASTQAGILLESRCILIKEQGRYVVSGIRY